MAMSWCPSSFCTSKRLAPPLTAMLAEAVGSGLDLDSGGRGVWSGFRFTMTGWLS